MVFVEKSEFFGVPAKKSKFNDFFSRHFFFSTSEMNSTSKNTPVRQFIHLYLVLLLTYDKITKISQCVLSGSKKIENHENHDFWKIY